VPDVDFDPSDPATTGKVMQFRVVDGASPQDTSFDPAAKKATIRKGSDKIVRLVDPVAGTLANNVRADLTRELTLVEIADEDERIVDGIVYDGGPEEVLVNNTKWMGKEPDPTDPNKALAPRADFTPDGIGNWLSELPVEGTTEVWEIVNTTADAHPIHTHLAQFQLMNRQSYDPEEYEIAYEAAFPGGVFLPAYGPPLDYGPSMASGGKYGGNPDVTPFLNGPVLPPNPNEAGWKDTVFVPPGMVTRFVVRWAPTDLSVRSSASPLLRYAFLPNDSIPGSDGAIFDYVWHCHIVDHEDNEMMRPDAVVPSPLLPSMPRKYRMGRDY
jgi:spore coat protein A